MKGMRLVPHRLRWLLLSILLLCSWWFSPTLSAGDTHATRINTQTANFALIFPTQLIRPGSEVQGLIQFYLDPGWHLYWKNPGDVGVGPTFDWQLPQGIQIKEVAWPPPQLLTRSGAFFYGYENTPQWIVTMAFDEHMAEGVYPITLSAFWLACDGSCVPSSQQYEFSFTVSSSAPPPPTLPALIEAQHRVPISIQTGGATIDKDHLIIQIPVPKELTQQIKHIILFPETEGVFAVDQLPVWTIEGNTLELSILSLPTAKDKLIKEKQFVGILQLIATNKEIVNSYELHIPFITDANAAFVRPGPTLSQESQWKPVDVAQELTALHANSGMQIIILMAFLGGILLNFTPCVLPVVGLKVLNLISFRTLPGLRTFTHGLLFTLGVLTTFWILAGGLYLFEYLGTQIGWGFQLQNPLFVTLLTVLLFCFALNLFGVFEIGTSVSSWASEIEGEVGKSLNRGTTSFFASFSSGVLATLVATPCTGPLLGSVLGFASTFEPIDGMILFSVIGFGMAFPFLVITAFPILIRLLPRPGLWMVTLKQFFGFCLLTTIAWLLWVLNAQVPSLPLTAVASSLLLLAIGLWIFGLWGSPVRSLFCRFLGRAFSLLFLIAGIFILVASVDPRIMPWVHKTIPQQQTIHWEPFSKERLNGELTLGHTVFVEFSAKWCLTCQTNKLSFLTPSVVEAFQKYQLVALEADWTNGDPAITSMLRSLGRNGVPVYGLFRHGREPVLLPEIVTPEIIAKAIEDAAS